MQIRCQTRQDKVERAAGPANKIVVPKTGWCGIKWLPVVVPHFPSLSTHLQILTQLNSSFPRSLLPDFEIPLEKVT